jgi:hypothetical protein
MTWEIIGGLALAGFLIGVPLWVEVARPASVRMRPRPTFHFSGTCF